MKAEDQKTQLPKQPKKVWQKPDFYLIDSGNINAKYLPHAREATGHVFVNAFGSKFWATPGNGNGFILTSSAGVKMNNVSSAIS